MRITGVTYVSRKTHGVRKLVLTALFLLLIIALAVALLSVYWGWNIVHPERKDIKPFTSNIVPEYRNLSFNSKDASISLSGWLFSTDNSDKTVILAHGYGQNRLQFGEQTLDIIKSFQKEGYNILVFDFRNSGKSDGKITTMGFYEKEDLLGAVDYVKSQGAEHIVLMGFSTGASTCILAAADSSDVDAVIADSPFSDLRKYIGYSLSKKPFAPAIPFNKTVSFSIELLAGINVDKVNPARELEKMTDPPILFIHSKDDKRIPVENSKKLYNIYSSKNIGKTELWMPEGAGHTESYKKYPKQYMNKVFTFLERVLE